MDAYNEIVSAHSLLNEQIARNVFDALPERGPIVAIMDRAGHCRSSDPQEFAKLNLSASLLADLRAKVDDGVEPTFACAQDASVTVAQLPTEDRGCGYVLVAVPRYGSELTQTHLDLVESLLNQIALVATLVEHNHALKEMQARHFGIRGPSEATVN